MGIRDKGIRVLSDVHGCTQALNANQRMAAISQGIAD